jgi:hypothetical protein
MWEWSQTKVFGAVVTNGLSAPVPDDIWVWGIRNDKQQWKTKMVGGKQIS